MKPILRCAKERIGANLASALQGVCFAGWSFVFEVRSVPTTQRTAQLRRPNNKGRRYGQAEMGSFHICSPVDRRWRGRVHDRPTGVESGLLFRRRFWIADIYSWIVASYTNFVSKAEPLKIGEI